jgi:CRISPR type I-E-associated protein CasB/Cse2
MSDLEEAKPETVFSRVHRIADMIAGQNFGTGDLAALRRNDPAHVVGQPAFHRLMTIVGLYERPMREDVAILWGTIIHLISLTVRNGWVLRSGQALAKAGISEARFAKLMAARGPALGDQLAMAARYIKAKQIPIDWTDFAVLLLTVSNEEKAAACRFRIAQNYYRELDADDRAK